MRGKAFEELGKITSELVIRHSLVYQEYLSSQK
jgi:hypothetical protein